LGAFCHKGKLTFLKSVLREDSFDTHLDQIQFKKFLGLLGLGGIGKVEVVFEIGFLAILILFQN
jgi:hypothetical protein